MTRMKKTRIQSMQFGSSYLLKISAVVALLLTSFAANTISAQNTDEDGLETIYHIYNDDDYVGAVEEVEPVERLVEEKVTAMSEEFEGLSLQASDALEILPEQVFDPSVQAEEEVLDQLNEELAVEATSFALAVDGDEAVYLEDLEAYDETVRQLKLQHVTEEDLDELEERKHSKESLPKLEAGKTRILDVSIAQKVNGYTTEIHPEKIMDVEQAVKTLVEDFSVTVQVKKEEAVEERIAYKTEQKDDDKLYVGQTEIAEDGKDGTKKLTYEIREESGERVGRVVSDEVVSAEPVNKIVLNGTGEPPSKGTGKFAWPADGGYVSSERGQRWGRLHNGIDIAQPDSLDILSADHGVVKAAGAAGTFGNRVIVDHRNGYETIYAHLSSIDVKKGDVVPKGTKLGNMGNTGRSTGLHLHFEISLNGQTKNPLNYIK
ncbi:M23 family metallopeptidase [Planococcus salinus]|uniref:G5 domain-containing protein n=1 Tax=Planococcus salinus TaxID=1848460 RepID=A0A3M8P8B8_9BACL|nr:peptidoglycan DD-metalloendopeptidase family protein [Planococcus salinus]RNF39917.1 hypothetical protein EEX84_08125 [Planococcus salinus]